MLSDGAAVAVVLSKAGTGYIEYEAVVVRTIRKASRGLESARYVDIVRLSDFAGAAAAACESADEASGGKGISATSTALVADFNRLRRR